MAKYTEVFLKRFTVGENAAQLRQMLGLSTEEVNFMLAEIDGTNEVKVNILNNLDADSDSFALEIILPDCSEYDGAKFLFHNVNNSTYGATATISPPGDVFADNLDTKVHLVFVPTP